MGLESDDGLRLQAFSYNDVIGKNIVCDDGVTRRVEQLAPSFQFADKVLINEINEDETPGGAWVHMLSLSCQMYGNPLPTIEQMRAFSKFAMAMRWHQEPHEKGVTLPSGIVLPN